MSWLQIHEVTVPFYEVRAGKQVFAIQLRERALRQEELARNWSSITSASSQFLLDCDENDSHADNTMDGRTQKGRVTAMRSYSQFRKLWRDLIRATKMPSTTSLTRANSCETSRASKTSHHRGSVPSRRPLSRSLSNSFQALPISGVGRVSSSSCRCRNWNCTFRSFHHFLKSYPFPSKFVMKRSTPVALENRRQGLELFLSTVRGLFDTFPRQFLESVDSLENCQVLKALEVFFGNEKQQVNSWSRTTLQLPSGRKSDAHALNERSRFSNTGSLDSGSSGRTPSSTYSCGVNDCELGVEFYFPQDYANLSLHGSDGKQNDSGIPKTHSANDNAYLTPTARLSRLEVAKCSREETAKAQASARRSRYYRCINIRWQTAFLAQNPTMASGHEYALASGTMAPQTSLPGLPKLQITANEVTSIQTFLEEFRDHLLLGSRTLGNCASSLENWSEDRQWELALYVASQIGHVRAVESILYRGTNPSAVMEDGLSSLHAACRGGHRSIVAMLLTYGADTNATDMNGVSPLLSSVQLGDLEIVEMLVGYGANVNLCNTDNVSAVHVAVACQALPILQLLLEYDAFVNTPNTFNGKTPLHLAAQCGNLPMCEMLLQHGGNVHHQTARGLDVVALARSHGHWNVALFCFNFEDTEELTLHVGLNSSEAPQTAAGASTSEGPSVFYSSFSEKLSHEVTIVSEDGQAYAVL